MTTSIEIVRQAKEATGLTIVLKPFEQAQSVLVREGHVTLKVQTFKVKDGSRELVFTARGVRLIDYRENSEGRFFKSDEFTFWDDNYEAETIVKFGQSTTPREVAEREEYERMCYRPGNKFEPLDNYERVVAGQTTDAMARHW